MSGPTMKSRALRVLAFLGELVLAVVGTLLWLAAFALFWLATPPQCSAQADLDHELEAQLAASGAFASCGEEVAE